MTAKKSTRTIQAPVESTDLEMHSMNLALLRKIRCRFLDRVTGQPIAGVIANLSVAAGDGPSIVHFPVATLSSDATGYLAFDLSAVIDLELPGVNGIFLSAPDYDLANYDLIGSLLGKNREDPASREEKFDDGYYRPQLSSFGTKMPYEATTNVPGTSRGGGYPCMVFPIYLKKRQRKLQGCDEVTCTQIKLPSIQSPDICDYRVSPFSFVTPAALKLGNDCCEILLPSSLPVQQYSFYKVVVREANLPAIPTAALDTKLEVNVSSNVVSQALPIRYGEALQYIQEWFSLGHSLGEIKYSLPLAPGESTQLAIIEWSREDTAGRSDEVRATEFLDHDLRRDRAIEDTIDLALREEQGGNSHFGSTAGTASGQTYGTGMWTGNHAFGGGISYSYGNRNLEGDTLQDIHDRVRQASSYTRSLNSTVVVQGRQREGNTLQTRRVANHNHCHAITIQYYEVLRHYRISTKFSGQNPVVLVPFKAFSFTAKSWELALRFRTVLERTLLDPYLRSCFEALVRLNLVPGIYDTSPAPVTTPVKTPPPVTEKETPISVEGDKEQGIFTGINVLNGDKITMNASGLLAIDSGTSYGSGGFGPGGDGKIAQSGGNYPFIAPGKLAWSLIYKFGPTDIWRQGPAEPNKNMAVTAPRDGEIILNVNSMSGRFRIVSNSVWNVNIKFPVHEDTPTPKDESQSPEPDPRAFRKVDDELCSARLLRHLQDNQGYYNSAIWLLMDGIERRLYLENALKDRPDILFGIDDKPLAVSGSYLAFQFLGQSGQGNGSESTDNRTRPGSYLEDIVTLPTRGLFAEAQMGHCNSCEKRDVTRNSDWSEMTVETPPEISGISPGPKGTAPIVTQGQLPSNVIQIAQPPAAPDPTGLANALGVLETPNIFRDMSALDNVSQLLGRMVESATEANIKAMAGQAQVEIAKLQAEGKKNSSSGVAANTSSTGKQTPAERYDNLQVAKEVANSSGELGLSDQQKSDLAQEIIGGGGGGFYSTVKKMIEDTLKGATSDGGSSMDGGTAATFKYWTNPDKPRIVEITGFNFLFTPAGDGSNGTIKGDSFLTSGHTGTYKLQTNDPGMFVMQIQLGADQNHKEDIDGTLEIKDGLAKLSGSLKGEPLAQNGVTASVKGTGSKTRPFKIDFTGGSLQWY